jgi:hypothetical protein
MLEAPQHEAGGKQGLEGLIANEPMIAPNVRSHPDCVQDADDLLGYSPRYAVVVVGVAHGMLHGGHLSNKHVEVRSLDNHRRVKIVDVHMLPRMLQSL